MLEAIKKILSLSFNTLASSKVPPSCQFSFFSPLQSRTACVLVVSTRIQRRSVHGGRCLALDVFSVCHRVAYHISEKNFEALP